ncbi:unnamed protein product [Cylicocyclus nassatus]|uniref:C-type lectin domain-containing protein n=1 Tax=Cylicocyclus nassatus TaxID=53992 RepID=A0AA36DQ87_CYLNA|nr:unnamed protein product [Cylicocyclus nassatus]
MHGTVLSIVRVRTFSMKFPVLALVALAAVAASVDNKNCRCPKPLRCHIRPRICRPCPACHCACSCQNSKERFGHCEDGWTYYKKTDACYKVYHWKNFDDAEYFCQRKAGHLVSIHSIEENKFVTELAETGVKGDTHTKATWIGLKQADWPKSKEWTWTDGTKVDYSPPWAPNQPDNHGEEHCTQLFSDIMAHKDHDYQKWNDCHCRDSMRAFVCKKKALH